MGEILFALFVAGLIARVYRRVRGRADVGGRLSATPRLDEARLLMSRANRTGELRQRSGEFAGHGSREE